VTLRKLFALCNEYRHENDVEYEEELSEDVPLHVDVVVRSNDESAYWLLGFDIAILVNALLCSFINLLEDTVSTHGCHHPNNLDSFP
jgi:hypothetical protein